MPLPRSLRAALALSALAGGLACDSGTEGIGGNGGATFPNPLAHPPSGPPAGNPAGTCPVPAEASPADVSRPDRVIGDGTAGSCTAEAFLAAVAEGGTLVFACGPDPVTLTLPRPARVRNDGKADVVIDGGGLVTLSGGMSTRILYMNACDPELAWTTSHCDDQDHPRLTVQNLTFRDGDSRGEDDADNRGGGGAIWARGGRLKVVNCRFFDNVCALAGPDVGGAAIRAFDQHQDRPVFVVNSTFGGEEGYGNTGSNGGGIGSIGVSWTLLNSVFSHNRAVGEGGNPARPGTEGGGSGGAVYNDGNAMTLSLCGTLIEKNSVTAHGSGIFFVSNDHSGNIALRNSMLRGNTGGTWYARPGISMHEDTRIEVEGSTLE